MNGDLIVTNDVAGAFAERVRMAYDARPDSDRFSLALSGGSTARSCYAALAKESIDWSAVTALWSDERCVPLDHADSNYLLAKEALLDQVMPLAGVHPMRCDLGAVAYDEIVSDVGPVDVVHLGLGVDGHIASLFPGSPALDAPPERLVVETGDDLHDHPRMTFTYSAINRAHLVILTVIGAGKRETFARIQEGAHLPAGRVAAHQVVWLVDDAAAGASA